MPSSIIVCFLQCVERTLLRRFRNFIRRFCNYQSLWSNKPTKDMLDNDLLSKSHDSEQIRVLILNQGEHQDAILYRLKKGWKVEFKPGASLLGRTIDIFINHPLSANQQFNRYTYYQPQWVDESATIHLTVSGSFHYYLCDRDEDENTTKIVASGYLLVDPDLKIGEEELPLDCLQMQTVLTKCLGPLSTWENKLLVTRNSGYNAIHFTPIQQLGNSNSSYSLSDQMKVNPAFNDNNMIVTYDDIERFVNKIRVEWKMLSVCDVVLNHTANESPFLVSHPECTYNCFNSPYLRPAYILDATLFEFTTQVTAGDWEFKGIPTVVETEDHLNAIDHVLRTHFLPLIKIHEMYIVDVNEIVAEFLNLARNEIPDRDTKVRTEQISVIQDPCFRRLKSTIDIQLALAIYNIYRNDCFDEETRLKRCAEVLKNKLEELNNTIINDINNHLNSAISNTTAGIRYFRVQSNGPRIKEINEKNPLIPR